MSSRYRISAFLVAICLLAAGALWVRHGGSAPSTAPVARPIPVTMAPVEQRDVPLSVEGLGNVLAFNTVTVHTQVDGQIEKIVFREGQQVHVGDLLVQIDPRTYQAQRDQAVAKKAEDVAQLANAVLDLKRYAGLVDQNFVSHQQRDTAQAQVDSLRASVQADDAAIENAQAILDYTQIKSPIDGRVGIRQVDVGNIVHPADAAGIVVVTQTQPISVIFTVPEDALPAIQAAQQQGELAVTVTGRDGSRVLDQGALQLVDNLIDTTTGTVRLKATLPNKDGHLWPGQFVMAKLGVGQSRQAIVIPVSAVQHGPNGAYCYVVQTDHHVVQRAIEITNTVDDVVLVRGGVAPGEQVVTSGQYRLQAGALVTTATAGSAP